MVRVYSGRPIETHARAAKNAFSCQGPSPDGPSTASTKNFIVGKSESNAGTSKVVVASQVGAVRPDGRTKV